VLKIAVPTSNLVPGRAQFLRAIGKEFTDWPRLITESAIDKVLTELAIVRRPAFEVKMLSIKGSL
jgi:hypothetical protein